MAAESEARNSRAAMTCAAALPALLLLAAAPTATVKLSTSGEAAVNAMAPSFGGWDLTGTRVLTLDALREKPRPAPLLLTFGASFCEPCRAGLPRLKKFADAHPGLRLVLIDVETAPETAQQFARATLGEGALALLDKFETIARTYGLADDGRLALPRTFLIAANGRVQAIYREEGPDLEAVLEKDLRALPPPKQAPSGHRSPAK